MPSHITSDVASHHIWSHLTLHYMLKTDHSHPISHVGHLISGHACTVHRGRAPHILFTSHNTLRRLILLASAQSAENFSHQKIERSYLHDSVRFIINCWDSLHNSTHSTFSQNHHMMLQSSLRFLTSSQCSRNTTFMITLSHDHVIDAHTVRTQQQSCLVVYTPLSSPTQNNIEHQTPSSAVSLFTS